MLLFSGNPAWLARHPWAAGNSVLSELAGRYEQHADRLSLVDIFLLGEAVARSHALIWTSRAAAKSFSYQQLSALALVVNTNHNESKRVELHGLNILRRLQL